MDEGGAKGIAPIRVHGSLIDLGGKSSRSRWAFRIASIIGLGLISLWVGLFVASVRRDAMIFGGSTWVPALTFMAGDFKFNIDHIVRVRALGFKPHEVPGDFYCATHPYPPMVSRYFRWVLLVDPMKAATIWQGALAVFTVIGCFAARNTRRAMGLTPIPLVLIIATVLFSTPFLFAQERGQCDPMIVPPMVIAAWLLGRRDSRAEFWAGGLLGLTAWVKYYPGLTVIPLLMLGRKWALASFAGVVAVVGLIDHEGILQSIKVGLLIQNDVLGRTGSMFVWGHALIDQWRLYGFVRNSPFLRQAPTLVLAAVALLPAILVVGRRVARAKDPRPLILPFFLWITSAGTFALPYSNDYNLTTLPLAILAVWDRRDRCVVHLALALSLLWIQPIWLPIDGGVLFDFKLGAIYAVGICLADRAVGTHERVAKAGLAVAFRPTFARLARSLNPVRNARNP